MYYTRAVRTRFQQLPICWLSAGVLLAAAATQAPVDATTAWARAVQSSWIDPATAARVQQLVHDHEVRVDTWRQQESPASVELAVLTRPGTTASQQLIDAARQSLDVYAAMLGPPPFDRLTIVDLPVHAGLTDAAYPGIAIASVRWLTARREFALEREMSAAIGRQYALTLVTAAVHDSWFAEGLAAYLATRAEQLRFDPRPSLTRRYFGGFVPHAIRAVTANPLDPRPRVSALAGLLRPVDAPWRLARGADLDRAKRLAVAFHALERFIGWPALQAALSAFVQGHTGQNPTLRGFTELLSAQRGADMAWFFDQAMRLDARLDYAVVNLQSSPASPAGWHTTVEVRRLGEATFAGTSVARDVAASRALEVVTRFADGNEMTEWIDGRDTEWRFEYSSATPATLASVDPEAIVLVDDDRTNNARALNPAANPTAMRLAFNWLAWLQDAMLTCTAVL